MSRTKTRDIVDQFRSEIRSRQKQELFQQIRMKFDSQNHHQWSAKAIVEQLNSNMRVTQNLKQLIDVLQESNNYYKIIMQAMDSGLNYVLINFLDNEFQVFQTITLISIILAKKKVQVADKFVKLGLIEHLVKYSESDITIMKLCMNIFGNIMNENIAYSELFLVNNMQRLLGNLLKFHVLSKQTITNSDEEVGFVIMWVLETIAQSEYGDQYKPQYLQIFDIVLGVMKRDILHVVCIQIIFLLHSTIQEEMKYQVTGYINKLLLSLNPEANYIKYFLIIIKVFMPIEIDCLNFAYFILKCPKYISYSLKIIHTLLRTCPERFPIEIINNEIWWNKIFNSCNKLQDKESYIKILNVLGIEKEWVFPMISELLIDSKESSTLIVPILNYLHKLLRGNLIEERRDIDKIVYWIRSYQIDTKLESVYQTNASMSKQCEVLLGIINARSQSKNY